MMGSAVAALSVAQMASANDQCIRRSEKLALKTAAVQQQLMVAALTCHAIQKYNRFVVSYRGELLRSDNALKAFFIKHGSVADYHAFKTKLANNSSLTSIGDPVEYCHVAYSEFDVALAPRHAPLREFVAEQNVPMEVAYSDCRGDDTVVVASHRERRALRRMHRQLAKASAEGEP
jgi:hypothetical protein